MINKKDTLREEHDGFNGFGMVIRDMENGFKSHDYEPVLKSLIPQLQIDHKEGFSHETTPGGEKWKPNAPSTIKRKGHGRVLFETGALEESLTQDGAANAIRGTSRAGLLFGTGVEYAAVNQETRPHVGLKEVTLQRIANDVADSTVESLKLKL